MTQRLPFNNNCEASFDGCLHPVVVYKTKLVSRAVHAPSSGRTEALQLLLFGKNNRFLIFGYFVSLFCLATCKHWPQCASILLHSGNVNVYCTVQASGHYYLIPNVQYSNANIDITATIQPVSFLFCYSHCFFLYFIYIFIVIIFFYIACFIFILYGTVFLLAPSLFPQSTFTVFPP